MPLLILLIACASLPVRAAFKCVPLDGAWFYQEVSGMRHKDVITIRQDFCRSITVESDWLPVGPSPILTDGQEHLVGTLGRESGKRAGCLRWRTAAWEPQGLRITSRLDCPGGGAGDIRLTILGPDSLRITLLMGSAPSSSDYSRLP